MKTIARIAGFATLVVLPLLLSTPIEAEAQGRGNRARGGGQSEGVTLTVEVRTQIESFYSSRPSTGAEALPPGIRRNLERGKELPPGIAKRSPPDELAGQVPLPDGYELVEVGLDVFLVEVATNIIHDVLMDIIR